MNTEKDRHADTIIRAHSMYAMASGAIPFPLADIAAVTAVQLDMIKTLCQLYEVDYSTRRGKAIVVAIGGSTLARVGAASVVKLVPIAGTLVGSAANGVLSAASTYAVGNAFKIHLKNGGTFLDLDTERFTSLYREQFEKGKEIVKEWQKEREQGSTAKASEPEAANGFDMDAVTRKPKAKKTEDSAEAQTREPEKSKSGFGDKPPKEAPDAQEILRKLELLSDLRKRELISEADFEATKTRLLEQL